MSTYKLVIKGEVLPGQNLHQVKARIAQLFKLQGRPDYLEAVFSSRPVVVKRGLDAGQARRYYAAIQQAGMRCQVVAESEVPAVPSAVVGSGARPGRSRGSAVAVERVPVSINAPVLDSESTVSVAAQLGYDEVSSAVVSPKVPDLNAKVVDPEPFDPYRQPAADLNVASGEAEGLILTEPRKLSAGAGLTWLMEGFDYFKLSPWRWVGSTLLLLVMLGLMSLIPYVSLAVNMVVPVFAGGFMLATYRLDTEEYFSLGDVFAGFKINPAGLLLVGTVLLVAPVAIVLVGLAVMLLTMGGLDGALAVGWAAQGGALLAMSGLFAPLLVVMVLLTVMTMAAWFAPALIVLHDVPPLTAMLMSLKGCRRNMIPFFVYSVVGFVSMIVASIPFMLGWLVVLPVLVASVFAGYRQIFVDTEDTA